MNREQYNAARRDAYRAEQHARKLSDSVAYGYGRDEANAAYEYAGRLRAALRPRIDYYWQTRNARAESIQRRCREAVRAKRHADHVKRELPKLIPTGNRIEDAMREVAVRFGGRTAAQAMGVAA